MGVLVCSLFRVVNNATNGKSVQPPPKSGKDWLGPTIGAALAIVSAPAAGFGIYELGMAALANPVAATNIVNGGAEVLGGDAIGGATVAAGVALTEKQAANLVRFERSLPKGNTGTAVDSLGDGVVFTANVPGNVHGSNAVYQKTVDAAGDTSSFLKTTTDPVGQVVHVKDKINNVELPKP